MPFELLLVICVFVGAAPADAACTPCTPTYTLTVNYTLGGVPQIGTLNGTATIIDGALDANIGFVQSLLTAQVGAGAILTDVVQIALNGTPGAIVGQNDTLLTASGDVVAWVEDPSGPTGHLHFSTLLTHAQTHPFDYTYSASGTESPAIAFSYTLTASGNETFRTAAHLEQRVHIDHYDPNKAECQEVEGDACLPVGSKRTSSRLDEYSSSPQLLNSFTDNGDRCSHYHIKVSSTNGIKRMCGGSTAYDCSFCGAWYEGIAVLDGFRDAQRPWTRSISGTGQAEGKPKTDFTVNYATAGGALGSGQSDTIGLFGSPSFAATLSNCKVGTTAILCNNLGTSIAGNVLTVSTVYTQPVGTSKSGSSTLKSSDGVKTIDALPFTAENNDVRHTVEINFQGTVYRDNNGDGFVDVGPFSFWTGGGNNDQLLGAFNRSGFPVATIDSIVPNPALLAQTVQFTGHGTGPFTTFQWFTHRLDQPGGTLIGTSAAFPRSNLVAGMHQIRFGVVGLNPSPFTYATLTVNQPPIAFINHIENVNDPGHPTTALLLSDGAQTDPFDLDGGGIDFDGTVAAFEWSSNIEPGNILGTTAHLQKSLTALGTHTISFRVRDNAGVWSTPVKQTVVVRRPPVLLIHGLCGDITSWDDVINNGWLGPQWTNTDIVRRTFDANGDGITNDAPADNAVLVSQQIQQMKQTFNVRTVNILDHSMGGLDARAYIQGPAYQGDVNKLVMLATPNHGSTIADLALISNGYSESDVGLFIPIPKVVEVLHVLGIIVDIVDWIDPQSGLACLGQDSPALHALRPHSQFLRNLNHTSRDDGTEAFGDSGLPNDFVPDTQAFVIYGERLTVSHLHLPDSVVQAIKTATLGQVDLTNMSLLWARDGDGVVTAASAQLDGIPSDHFDHRHRQMEKKADSVGKGLFYLLDDPPQAEARTSGGPVPIAGAHLLGAGRATVATTPAATLNVDAAAQRLRVSVTWAQTGRSFSQQANARIAARISIQPLPLLVLTSPSGVRFSSDVNKTGFSTEFGENGIDAAVETPEAGAWKLELTAPTGLVLPRGGLTYTWLAFEESSAFVAVGLSAETVAPSTAVTIAALVQNNNAGVTGADVRAAVSDAKEKPVPLTLVADSRMPGLYTATFTPPRAGVYRVLTAAKLPGAAGVTRFNFLSFESRVPPELAISLTASTTQPRLGDTVTLSAKVDNRANAALSRIPVRVFDGPPKNRGRLLADRIVNLAATSSVTITIPWTATVGAHQLVAIVDPMNVSGETNTADNVATLSIGVRDTKPPVAQAGPDQMAMVGQNVIFDGRASTDDDRIVSYHWTVLPNPSPAARRRLTQNLDGAYVALPGGFPAVGTNTVRLTVTDTSGNSATDDVVVRVVDKFDTEPPVANAGRDITVIAGQPVKFDGSASRDNYGIALATWDIDLAADSDGDGNPSNDQDLSGLTPTLARGYAKPGTYRARLTLRDAVGNGPSTAEVTVKVVVPTVANPIGGGDKTD